MKLAEEVMADLRVRPGEPAGLDQRSTSTTRATWIGADEKKYKRVAQKDLRQFVDELTTAQELLWANGTHALLIVLQAMDAAGKDGTIKHVMSGVNPQGCRVEAFRQPSAEELGHDFLWRASTVLPARGMIGIFNRSYYEEVLVTRVHPELLQRGKTGSTVAPSPRLWSDRYEDINAFEHHLDRNGTRIVKVFLHVCPDQQKQRFLERLDAPGKAWKFSADDLAERKHWDAYQRAYEEALTATSTPWAPWFVVPADHKYALRARSAASSSMPSTAWTSNLPGPRRTSEKSWPRPGRSCSPSCRERGALFGKFAGRSGSSALPARPVPEHDG